jgi:hypothetical protein
MRRGEMRRRPYRLGTVAGLAAARADTGSSGRDHLPLRTRSLATYPDEAPRWPVLASRGSVAYDARRQSRSSMSSWTEMAVGAGASTLRPPEPDCWWRVDCAT